MDPKLILGISSSAVPERSSPMAPPPPAPTLPQVLYSRPNPNGEPKACGNCFLWVRAGACLLYDRKVQIGAQAWCPHHVYGQPHDAWEPHHIRPLDPRLIRRSPGGVACDACVHYEPTALEGGLCFGTMAQLGGPGRVEAKGACARYSPIRIGMPADEPQAGRR